MSNSYTISIQVDAKTKGAEQIAALEAAILKLAGQSQQAAKPTTQLVDAFGNAVTAAPKASKAVAAVGQAAVTAAADETKLGRQAGETTKALKDQGETAAQTGTKTRNMGQSLASGYAQVELLKFGIEKLYGAIKQAWTGFTAFETKMVNVRTLAALTDAQFKQLGEGVLALSRRNPQSADALADGLYQLQSAGVDARQAVHGVAGEMGALELAARAATAGLGTTEQAVDVGTSILNAYRKPVTALEGDFDVLFQTINLGKTTFPELSQSLGLMLPRAAATGTSLEELSAALVQLTNQGVRTPEAVTRISEAIRALSTPNPEAQPYFKQLGIEWKGLLDTIRQVKEKGLSNADLKRLVPDQQAYDAVLALTNDYDGLIGTLDKLKDSSGAAANAFALQADTTANKTQLMKNELSALATEGLEGVARVLSPLLQGLKGLLSILEPLPQGLKSTAAGLIVLEGATLAAVAALKMMNISLGIGLGPLSAIVLGVGALAAGLGYLATKEEEAHKARMRDNAAQVTQLKQAEGLTREYKRIAQQLESGVLKTEQRRKAEERLKTIKEDLIKISPAYQDCLKQEENGLLKAAEAMDQKLQKDEKDLRNKYDLIKSQRDSLKLELAKAQQDAVEIDKKPDMQRMQEKLAYGAGKGIELYIKGLTDLLAKLDAEIAPLAAKFDPKPQTKSAEETAEEEAKRKALEDERKRKSQLTTQQQLEAARKTAEGEALKIKDILDREKTNLQQSLEDGQISIAQYWDRLEAAELKSLQDLIAAKQKLRDKEAASQMDAGAVSKLDEEMAVLQRKEQDIKNQAKRGKAKDLEEFNTELKGLEAALLEAQGETARARAIQITLQYRETLKKMVGDSGQAGREIIQKLIDIDAAKARADQLRQELDFTQAQLSADEISIQNLQNAGIVSSLQAQEMRAQAIEAKLPAMRATLEKLKAEALQAQATAQTTGKPEDQKAADNLALQAQQMGNTVATTTIQLGQLKDAWFDVKKSGADALSSGLFNTLMAVGKGAGAVEDAFKGMASGVVNALQQVLTKLLLIKAAEAMLGGAAAGGNTFAQAFIGAVGGSYAIGGWTGPGGKYEPAGIVHRDEYVHDQETVHFWGTRFLASLHPRNWRGVSGFASGGQVGPPSAGSLAAAMGSAKQPPISVMPIIVYDMEAALEKAAQAPRGTKAIIRVVNDNPEAMGGSR